MKRYLIGLALTGLGARLTKRASGVLPGQRRTSGLGKATGILIAAGVGAGLARLFSKKS
jgi:hypothetical protein